VIIIPSVLAHEAQYGVEDFLRTTFPFATPPFNQLLESLREREDGLIQGPYFSINLPSQHSVHPHARGEHAGTSAPKWTLSTPMLEMLRVENWFLRRHRFLY
jgi:hypothetical protein